MTSPAPSYHGYRFPSDIISQAVWLYHRFGLSFRDVEDLLAQRGITVAYETIRQWCRRFGPIYARRLRRRRGRLGDTWHLDELFVTINGRHQYLWRAVDEDGDVLDILVQSRRNWRAAVRFFRELLKSQGCLPHRLITDKLRSYAAAHRTVMPSVIHSTRQYEHNRAEVSHQPTRQRERQMRPSSRPLIYNGSPPSMVWCRISLGWVDICFGRFTTACCGRRPSSNGIRSRAPAERARGVRLRGEKRAACTKLTAPGAVSYMDSMCLGAASPL